MEESLIEKVADRAFNVTPDTIYGLLVGLLVLAVIYLAWSLLKQQEKLVELNVSTIEVLKDLNTSLLLLKEEGVQMTDTIKEQFRFTHEHVRNLIEKLKK